MKKDCWSTKYSAQKRRNAYDKFKLQKKQSNKNITYNTFLQHVEDNEYDNQLSISQILISMNTSEKKDEVNTMKQY